MARLIRHPFVERNLLRLKTATDWVIAKIVIFLLEMAKKLPPERSTAIAEKIARRLAPILPRYKLAKDNIQATFPEKSTEEVEEIARGVWGNVARTMCEYVFLDQLFDFDPDNPDAGRVEVSGIENFLEIRGERKPVIIFTAHTGNWEILPIAAATYDLNVTAPFRTPNNRFLADRLLQSRMTEKGYLVPSRAGAAWALADVLARDQAVGLLADQAFAAGPHIEFFGRTASANPLAANLARQFDCNIYPARCIRLPNGRFRLELADKIELPRTSTGAVDIVATTRALGDIMETWIREYPEQWLWLHNRWKISYPERKKWKQTKPS